MGTLTLRSTAYVINPLIQPLILSAKQGGIRSHFLVFGMTRPGIEPQPPSLRADTNHKATDTDTLALEKQAIFP